MQTNTTQNRGGGEYLTPEITAVDIAVEKGFAGSTDSDIPDLPYDDEWENNN